MIDDKHRGLKRWERARQLAGLDSDPELVGPLAWCRIKEMRPPNGGRGSLDHSVSISDPIIKVNVVRIFAKDLVCVYSSVFPLPTGIHGPYWLVRGGIQWPEFYRAIIRHYRVGLPVPEAFRGTRKIGMDIISKMEILSDRDLPAIFFKLRQSGLLPSLPVLERSTCPTALAWDNLRACFQDFQNQNSDLKKDSDPSIQG